MQARRFPHLKHYQVPKISHHLSTNHKTALNCLYYTNLGWKSIQIKQKMTQKDDDLYSQYDYVI